MAGMGRKQTLAEEMGANQETIAAPDTILPRSTAASVPAIFQHGASSRIETVDRSHNNVVDRESPLSFR